MRQEIDKILGSYLNKDKLVDETMAFLQKWDSQKNINFERLNTLIEFVKCYPITKKSRTAANGMDLVMKNDHVPFIKSSAVEPAESGLDHQQKLIEMVWTKIMERYRTSAAAFRSFDVQAKGKVMLQMNIPIFK